jgi:SNF2 family DNA or RNA helicase
MTDEYQLPRSFAPGDAVVVRASGETGVVVRDRNDDMFDVSLPDGVRLVHVADLADAAPEADRLLLQGTFGSPEPYALRLQSLYLQHAYRFDPLSGLSNARIEPQFHQVFVAWRVNQKLAPRMILADEVGLGKTIEAGMIIKELRARGLGGRILIVCPSSLQLQWQQELKTKFNERFEIIDGAAVKHLGRDGTNPWLKHDSVICSLPFASNKSRVDAIIESDWDLVVFDEAHRVRRWLSGRTPKVTQAYRLADELKDLVSGLLLLTATPMQLHSYELYSLIELVEPGLFPGFDTYERQRAELPSLNRLVRDLLSWDTLSPEDIATLCQEHDALLAECSTDQDIGAQLSDRDTRERIIDSLAQTHPLADVLIRNRKSEVGGFITREASSFLVQLTNDEAELYEEITEYCRLQYDQALATKNRAVGFLMVTYQKMLASSGFAIRSSFERRIAKLRKRRAELAKMEPKDRPEGGPDEDTLDAEEMSDVLDTFESASLTGVLLDDEISILQQLVERLGQVKESKAFELLQALDHVFSAHPDEKVLVFTSFKETQNLLRRVLEANGITVSIFNGSQNTDQKEEAIRSFRTKNQVLVSTEAGGEGRNLQFCHIVVNYDLPWNPMKVEQRIGRVDRIGQKHTVQIWNLACQDTIEERVLAVLDRRIGLFEESVGALEPILGSLEDDIVTLVMTKLDRLAEVANALELDVERKVREARAKDHHLADFAMDRASLRRDIVNSLLNERPLATHRNLREYATSVLRYAGGTLHDHADGGQVVTVSPQLAQRLKVRGSTVRGCFSHEEALRFEELDFFAFGNDLVQRLIALPEDENITVSARRDPTASEGMWVELWYEIEAIDIEPVGRFIRHLVGPDLQVSSSVVTEMPSLGERLNVLPEVPRWAALAIDASQQRYRDEYLDLRDIALSGLIARQEEARTRVERIFNYRKQRFESLIGDESAWIEKAERGSNERDKRILPARRGKLEKRRQDLERLKVERSSDLERIEAQKPRTTGRLLAAGLVVGQ